MDELNMGGSGKVNSPDCFLFFCMFSAHVHNCINDKIQTSQLVDPIVLLDQILPLCCSHNLNSQIAKWRGYLRVQLGKGFPLKTKRQSLVLYFLARPVISRSFSQRSFSGVINLYDTPSIFSLELSSRLRVAHLETHWSLRMKIAASFSRLSSFDIYPA